MRSRWGYTDERPAYASEDLDAATQTPELVPRDRVWVDLDHAQQGIGTASCGPGVLPQHRLEAEPTSFALRLSPVSRSRA